MKFLKHCRIIRFLLQCQAMVRDGASHLEWRVPTTMDRGCLYTDYVKQLSWIMLHFFCDCLLKWLVPANQPICETQPPASMGWVALSSVIGWLVGWLSRIGDISSHLHNMMFPSIQTIYFLWGYDPGNMSVSTYLLLLIWAQFTVV